MPLSLSADRALAQIDVARCFPQPVCMPQARSRPAFSPALDDLRRALTSESDCDACVIATRTPRSCRGSWPRCRPALPDIQRSRPSIFVRHWRMPGCLASAGLGSGLDLLESQQSGACSCSASVRMATLGSQSSVSQMTETQTRARGGTMRRAVITGVGVVSPYGCGVEQFWTALAAAESADPTDSHPFDACSFPTQVAGEVPDLSLDAAWLLGALADLHITAPAELPTQALAWQDAGCFRDRKDRLALLAALQAWQQAGCGPDEQTAWLSIGLGLEHALLADFIAALGFSIGRRAQPALGRASQRGLPATRFRTRVDLAADLIASGLGLRGPRLVNCSACATERWPWRRPQR